MMSFFNYIASLINEGFQFITGVVGLLITFSNTTLDMQSIAAIAIFAPYFLVIICVLAIKFVLRKGH